MLAAFKKNSFAILHLGKKYECLLQNQLLIYCKTKKNTATIPRHAKCLKGNNKIMLLSLKMSSKENERYSNK